MKIPAYILLFLLMASGLWSCKAKGHATNTLDTNTFDSVAVGAPLVLDTTIGEVPDDNSYQSPETKKIDDSLDNQLTDSGNVDTGAISLPK